MFLWPRQERDAIRPRRNYAPAPNHAALPLLPFAVPGGPLAIVSELVANRSQFTGRPITLETDTAAEQAGKVADHLYKAFAPNLVMLPGTHAWNGVANASTTGRTGLRRARAIDHTSGCVRIRRQAGQLPE